MSVANVFQIVKCPITCHSFNKDRSGNKNIYIIYNFKLNISYCINLK